MLQNCILTVSSLTVVLSAVELFRYVWAFVIPKLKDTLMQIWKSTNVLVFIWNTVLKISRYNTFFQGTWDMWKVCLQTFRNNICSKLIHILRNLQTSRANKTREFLGLGMLNFQGIVFIWTQTYREIFKSALVYLWND